MEKRLANPRRLGRAALAAVVLVALVVQLVDGRRHNGLQAENFFSFFTVLSNIAAVVVLSWAAWRPPGRPGSPPAGLRGAVTTYMCVTGLVYAVLLAPASADVGLTKPWVDAVVHEIAPIAVLADWLLDRPERRPEWRLVLAWLAPLFAYLIYSLVRGAIVDWYPYPFLDPDESGGYPGVATYSFFVLVVMGAIAAFLRWSAGRSESSAVATA